MNITEKNKNITILQISDTHLFDCDEKKLFDINTNKSFYNVIDFLLYKRLFFDYIFLTGDLSQDGSSESYSKLAKKIMSLNSKIYYIPGNHDDITNLNEVFGQFSFMKNKKKELINGWLFLFLNTKLEGSDEGWISQSELHFLDNALSTNQSSPVCIVMHHHPTAVNTPLIDKYILKNNLAFWNTIGNNDQIKLIITGHVHGDYRIQKNQIKIETCPATCMQLKKGSAELIIERNCGFKIFQIKNNIYHSETLYI